MTGVTALLAGGATATEGTISLSDLEVSATNLAPSTAEAFYSLLPSGDQTAFALPNGTWINPRSGMANFEVRATVTAGAVTTGATGSWLSLASTRTWTVSRSSVGLAFGRITVEIRRTGGTILASASINLSAIVS